VLPPQGVEERRKLGVLQTEWRVTGGAAIVDRSGAAAYVSRARLMRRLSASVVACCVLLLALAPATRAALITGMVIGEGGRPLAGATIHVVGAQPPCETTSAPDGTFSLSCAATGRYAVQASSGERRPWKIDDVELEPHREVQLNFMLLPATAMAPVGPVPGAPADTGGFWSRRLPNPVLATWQGRSITLRVAAIVAAAVSFAFGALTMLALGRRFGVETHRLSAGEVGDMVLNPHMPAAGERVTPIAVAGARGASASVSYSADEIGNALAARRYGLVFVALVVAPGWFALFALALAAAILVGQELYLFLAMLLVPAGFVITPIMIGIQALRRSR
jgi:hypothetical protein